MRFAAVALTVCLLVSGCGGGGEPAESATPKATTKAAPTPTKTPPARVAPPAGVAAPGDLSNFQCLADAKGVWNASGMLKNGTKKAADYQITVFVGQADDKEGKALTKQVQRVNAGGAVQLSLVKIPAQENSTQCYVQVLRK